MTYIVEKGHPMNGMCIVNEYESDGGELQAQYKGWYKPDERKWILYPLKKNSWEDLKKKIIPESAVKMGKQSVRRAPISRRTKKKDEEGGSEQIRLI